MSREGKGVYSRITICCVPAKDGEGKDTFVTNTCCQQVHAEWDLMNTAIADNLTIEDAKTINFNNALAYFYPKSHFSVIKPKQSPGTGM